MTAAAVQGEEERVGGGKGKRVTEKRARVRAFSHSVQYVIAGLLHYSTMQFLFSPLLPPSLLRSVCL